MFVYSVYLCTPMNINKSHFCIKPLLNSDTTSPYVSHTMKKVRCSCSSNLGHNYKPSFILMLNSNGDYMNPWGLRQRLIGFEIRNNKDHTTMTN